LHCALELQDVCERLTDAFRLAPFAFDCEPDNEWAISGDDDRVVHVSHAFEADLYHDWQPHRCPRGCNYWIVVSVRHCAPAAWSATWRADWQDRWMRALAPLGTQLSRT
jgi:hypothetical protein